LGTTKTPSVPDLDEIIRLYTSGIAASPHLQTSANSLTATVTPYLLYSTSALPRNMPKAYDLLFEVLEGPSYAEILANPESPKSKDILDRLKTVINSTAAHSTNSLNHAGHRYAFGLAAQGLTETMRFKQNLGGLGFIRRVNAIVEEGDAGVLKVLEKLNGIHEFLFGGKESMGEDVKGAVISNAELVGDNLSNMKTLLGNLKWQRQQGSQQSQQQHLVSEPSYGNTFVPLPFTVNYTAQAFVGVPYTHPDSPSLQILAEVLKSHFLHREVREKGGAYGGFAMYSALEGIFGMASYRDPPGAGVRTMDAYTRGVEWACEIMKHVGERELNEAKLSIFSGLDAPVSASQEGMTRFLTGVTDEMRQA
jgi:Zn-dependent M16 (insulinase) family peptidase